MERNFSHSTVGNFNVPFKARESLRELSYGERGSGIARSPDFCTRHHSREVLLPETSFDLFQKTAELFEIVSKLLECLVVSQIV